MALALEAYATIAEPRYGRQLQNKGIGGSKGGEGEIRVEYRDKPYKLDDGEVVILHRPIYSIAYLKFGKINANLQLSPRIAQPLHGIGLLARISDNDILAGEDPKDEDKDGISGRGEYGAGYCQRQYRAGPFWLEGEHSLICCNRPLQLLRRT